MSYFDDTRADWGARPPRSIQTVPIVDRREFFTHWNGGPVGLAGKPHTACLAAVRSDQAFHMDSNGWSDIGYNGLVCPHARLICGRGLYAAGAHCPDHNTVGLGFQFMVGTGETVTPAMFARMRRAYDDACDEAGRTLTPLGHRDRYATQCPGDQVHAWTLAGMPTTTPTPTGGFLMALTDAEQRKLLDAANRVLAYGNATPRLLNDGDGAQLRRDLGHVRDQVLAALDPALLAAQLAPMLAGREVTTTQLEAALRNVLGSVDDAPVAG